MSAAPSDGPLVFASVLEEGHVLDLVLHAPKGNVLTGAMMEALEDALREHRALPSLRAVLLRGEGRHFSFGASVEEHLPELAPAMLSTFHHLCRTLASYPVPVVAAVSGSCLGGAFELALVSHIVLAHPDAQLGCPEIKLGVFPPVFAAVGHHRLPGAVAERMLLTGGSLSGRRLHELGFVSALLEPGEGPDAFKSAALGWVQEHLLPLSAFALRQTASAFRSSSGLLDSLAEPLDRLEKAYLTELVVSHDGNEGLSAFLERRRPEWRDH